jgi:hypothetical protein
MVTIDSHGHSRREMVRVEDLDIIERAIECRLISSPGIDRSLDTAALPRGVVVHVEISALVEAVESRSRTRCSEV